MDVTFLRHAGSNVPRYTSYPTAAHFSNEVGSGDYVRWLKQITSGDRLSLYFHIPFCESLCWYCGCHTSVPNGYDRVARYLDHLNQEIDQVADRVPEDHGGVIHIHFGGGSPTYLKPDDFKSLLDHIRRRFQLLPDAELAVEVDPRTLTDEMIAVFQDCGINRVSLGVQDFDPDVQELIQRKQPFDIVKSAVDRLRAAHISALSFDLMYGLPGQTEASVCETARLAIALNPDRMSVFGYAHVPWFKKNQRAIDESRLPGPMQRFQQAEAISRVLEKAGYLPVGFDHFARPYDPLAFAVRQGRLRRNFQGYTDDTGSVLLGFGASAISTLPWGHVQNETRLGEYGKAIEAGRLATVRGVKVDSEDRLRAEAMERVMCDLSLDFGALCRSHDKPEHALDDALPDLRQLVRDGVVSLDGRKLVVLNLGRRFLRTVAQCFDLRSREGNSRHSAAV
jgi:oxygen-independent coproporphyrinogen-3 oxidase